MNLNGDDKRIQRLFRELRSDDESRAPEFDRVLEAAGSRVTGAQHGIRPMRLAMVVATLVIFALLAVVAVRQRQAGDSQKPEERAVIVPSPEPSPVSPEPSPALQPPKQNLPRRAGSRFRRVRHRRPATEQAIDTKSLFAWQSPTASLLKPSTEDLLMSLPRLGESLEAIKSFSADLWN